MDNWFYEQLVKQHCTAHEQRLGEDSQNKTVRKIYVNADDKGWIENNIKHHPQVDFLFAK